MRFGLTNLSKGSLIWHHEALPSDAKQCPEGQICRSVPYTNDSFFFLHTFLCKRIYRFISTLKNATHLHQPFCFWHHFLTLLCRALATENRDVRYNQCKAQVRTPGSEHQGQTSISDPDQNPELTCFFPSGMQEFRCPGISWSALG